VQAKLDESAHNEARTEVGWIDSLEPDEAEARKRGAEDRRPLRSSRSAFRFPCGPN
jgi:hypothetical protein